MRKSRQVELLERLLDVVDRGRPEPNCVESSIDAERYVSTARLDAERATLFRKRPIIVGRASELKEPGSFFTHEESGVPMVVTRDREGSVRAMLNVCRHRGTRLVAEPRGTAKAFVCRYHAWTYDVGGALGHVPMQHCFPSLDKSASGLVMLPSEVRHGFIWVTPTPGASIDVGSYLGQFDDDFAAFDLDRHIVFARSSSLRTANWKLVMDAFLEGYHVKSLHQRTLARFFADEVVVDTANTGAATHLRSVGARKNVAELGAVDRENWNVRASTTVFYNVFPNSILVFHPETVSHISLFPEDVDRVRFVHTMLAPREASSDAERVGWERTWELIDRRVFGEEDLAIAESIQSSLSGGFRQSFPLATLEHPIRLFHDAMDRALASTPTPFQSDSDARPSATPRDE